MDGCRHCDYCNRRRRDGLNKNGARMPQTGYEENENSIVGIAGKEFWLYHRRNMGPVSGRSSKHSQI